MSETNNNNKKTYRGNCHCAAIVYEITLAEIKKVTECNCSICVKKGTIYVWPDADADEIKYVKGDPSVLTEYTFNEGKFTHKFCPTCGTSVMITGHVKPGKEGEERKLDSGFNVRTFQHGQVDLWTIDRQLFDGKSLPPAHKEPEYNGPEPTGEVEGGKLYTGSCHCGAVTVAAKLKPIDANFQPVNDCNCSSCGRYGGLWTYPPKPQVVVQGKENFTRYVFGKRLAGKCFCKICGVLILNDIAKLSEEEVSKFDKATLDWYQGAHELAPINLRVLHGIDVKELKPNQFDGYAFIQPQYVEP
ncbi:glutathione-dependent formaldehyde-activating enzyme [Poronia punctata]|nr:glutathione-dependent formaldehyde-activating enzyme [Poronia punctata]